MAQPNRGREILGSLYLKLGKLFIDGVAVTASAAEINAMAGTGLSAAELAFLDGVVAGTAAAGKAVVLTTDKHIDTLVITDGGLKLGTGAGTAVSATAAELNYNDITTLGTGAASKAVVLDAGDDYVWPATGVLKFGVLKDSADTTITSTGAELNLVDGAVAGNSVASKTAMLDANKRLQTAASVGAAGTDQTAVEYGDGRLHQTVITVGGALPDIAGGADLAVGKLLYTFPAGAVIVESAYMSVGITQTQGFINADTPDVGLGTVIASGVVAVLGGTGTFENILTGQTAANCTGTATVKTALPTAGVPFIIEAADDRTLYLNVADGGAAR